MIDFHTHPVLIKEFLEQEPSLVEVTREVFMIRNNPQPLETFFLQMDVAGIDKAVLLPIDCTTTRGCKIFSNEQIAELCSRSDRFIGFASVDPHKKQAVKELEYSITTLGLKGLKLAPGIQAFYPNDKKIVYPIYEAAQDLGIPVLLHSGMSWEPKSMAKYANPVFLEDVAFDFPNLNIVIAHFGWPWVLETAMLALKYPNIYIDTSCLYFDNPKDFLRFVMTKQIPLSMIKKSLRQKILFGSNYPRVEIKNMVEAIRDLGLDRDCEELIFQTNSMKVLQKQKG